MTELLNERGLLPQLDARLDAFCLIEDESLRAESLKLVQRLREAGCAVDYPLTPAKPDKQFKRAQECNAVFTVRIAQAGSREPVVKIKNLKTREEKSADADEAVRILRPDDGTKSHGGRSSEQSAG